jgi:hypothetical protein
VKKDWEENISGVVACEYKTMVCDDKEVKTASTVYLYDTGWLTAVSMIPETYSFRQACALPVPGQATRSGFE